jgi:glycine reductase
MFGGIGGEEKASVGPQVVEGFVGPGKLVQDTLKDRGNVVATVICGDNYFAENTEEATEKIISLTIPYRLDVLIAGPAFNAGRYGIACGELCKTMQSKLGIPAVTGMYQENPGVDLYR